MAVKSFYNIGPWCQSDETFFGRNLQMFVISSSACTFQSCLIFVGKARGLKGYAWLRSGLTQNMS
jgi:hypothetical protein